MGDLSRPHIIQTHALEIVEQLLYNTMSVAQFIDESYIDGFVEMNDLKLDETEINTLKECIGYVLQEHGFYVITTDEHDEIFEIVQNWAKEKGYQ
jgi:hypothetical protein